MMIEQPKKQKQAWKKENRWTPEPGRNRWLDAYIDEVKEDIISGLSRNKKFNLTKQETAAFQELLTDESIVIRPADKGSGVVVMNSQDYIDKLEANLLNSGNYSEVEKDMTHKISNKIKNLVTKLHKKD